jgi:1-acyl-sn-glycerol-3-phosphate acyltransferase
MQLQTRDLLPRSLKFGAFVLSLLAVGAAFLPLSLVPAPHRWHLKARLLTTWSRIVLKAFGIRVSEEALAAPSASGSRVIVANHVSYLDIPVLLARSPCLFLGKEEITLWPIIGWIAKRSGMVFVKRESLWSRARSVLSIQDRVQAGLPLVVFPEGTTSVEGPRKGRSNFFAGAFRAARMGSCPIEMVYIEYESEKDCAWLGDDDFVSHLWTFLGRKRTQVRLRTEWIDEVPDRAAQRRTTAFTRHWLLQNGRNLDLRSRPERAASRTEALLVNSRHPAVPTGRFVEA